VSMMKETSSNHLSNPLRFSKQLRLWILS